MQTLGQYPFVRMRRMRHDDFSRRLMRETVLTPNDLILPVFVQEGEHKVTPVPTMPGVNRLSIDELLKLCGKMVELGIPMVALFPHIDDELKTPDGVEAANPDGLIPRAVKAIKAAYPQLGVMCDVALDPYTHTVRTVSSTKRATSSTTKPLKCSCVRFAPTLRPALTLWLPPT